MGLRNTPTADIYRALWAWVLTHRSVATYGLRRRRSNFTLSQSTWNTIIRPEGEAAGFTTIASSAWSIADTSFVGAVRQMQTTPADIVVLSAHSRTTCGVLREMARQSVHPRLVVGLTSAITEETFASCGDVAEGMLAPTTFVPTSPSARAAATAVAQAGGAADLHSMAAWEIVFALRDVIERADVHALPTTVAEDRGAIRGGLAALTAMEGLLGPIQRTPDRESLKPFVLVRAATGHWTVVPESP